jgi:hypothetical protein
MSHNLDLLHAAHALGISPDELAALAGEGDIPSAQLTIRGWRFSGDVIATLAAGGYPRRRAPQVPDVPA